jgi:hypothetical protein
MIHKKYVFQKLVSSQEKGEWQMKMLLENLEEKAVIFIDYHNLEGSLRNEGYQVDLLNLRNYLSEGRKLIETFVYIGFNPNKPLEDKHFHGDNCEG